MIETLLSFLSGLRSEEAGLVVLGIACLASALAFLPRSPICIIGGAMFGLKAFPVVVAANTLGAVIAFLLSRHLFRSQAHGFAERRPRLRVLVEAVDAEGWRLLGLIRLASPVPGTASNFLFGLTRMGLWTYIAVTALGSAPQIFAFVYLGTAGQMALNGESVSQAKFMLTSIGLVLAFLAIGLVARRARSILSARLAQPAASQV